MAFLDEKRDDPITKAEQKENRIMRTLKDFEILQVNTLGTPCFTKGRTSVLSEHSDRLFVANCNK